MIYLEFLNEEAIELDYAARDLYNPLKNRHKPYLEPIKLDQGQWEAIHMLSEIIQNLES
jgi:hypothetical protein